MFTALVGSAFILAACGSPQEPSPPRAPAARPATVRLFASAAAAPVGSRISVSLSGSTADGAPVLGIDGWLRFAPAALRFAGRAVDSATTIAVNESGAARGRLRVLAVRPGRLEPDVPVLVFEVLQADYLATLEFEPRAIVGATRQLHRANGVRRAEVRHSLSGPGAVRAAAQRGKALKQFVTPTIYGDADGSGAVAQADADLVGDWIVGNGAPPDTVTFNLANVAPQNLPGIGGPTDDDPPGWGFLFPGGGFIRQAALTDPPISQGCDRGLAVDDLLLIAQEAGGTNVEVPGEVMPAGSQPPTRCGGVPAVFPDSIVWPNDQQPVVESPTSPGFIYYRTIFAVVFEPGTSAAVRQTVLSANQALVIGGMGKGTGAEAYVILVPDVGPNFSDLEAYANTLVQEPSVQLVVKMTASEPLGVKGRYPLDGGVAASRSNWTNPANVAIRPYLAIRAQLAWSCENGLYTTPAVRVGMFDTFFDNIPSDLTESVEQVSRPSTDASQSLPMSQEVANQLGHGYGVAGIIAARGDNGVDMPGMMWRVPLDVFAMATQQRETMNRLAFFDVALHTAAARGVRAMNLSVTVGNAADSGHVRLASAWLRTFLSGPGGRLVVVATGDSSLTRSLAVVGSSSDKGITAVDRALALLADSSDVSDRILFVTGTVPSTGARRLQSNVWTGAPIIAAPAEDIATLRVSTGLGLRDGTSFATAFVTGVAAQLWTLDPALPAAQVRRYILDGARTPGVPRRNPTTGAVIPPNHIGVPGVYQLDAYGSLSLLSRERAGTPICGVEVSAPDGRSQTELEIHRNSVQRFPTARGGRVSVAQGGRRLALGNESLDTTFVYSHTGQLLHVLPGVYQRFYTEKDTVDLQFYMQHLGGFDRDGTRVRRTGPSDFVDWFDPAERARGTATRWFDGGVLPSPDGEWIVLWANYDMTAQCSNQPNLYAHYRILLVPLGSMGFTALHANVRQGAGQSCTPQGDPADRFEDFSAAWRPAADSLVLAFPRFNDTGPFLGSQLEIRAAVANSPRGTTGSEPAFLNIWSIEPDGVRLRTVQSAGGGGGCEFRRILAASPFTDLESEPGCVQFEDEVDRVLPLLRNSRRTAMRATPTTRH